jgi:glycosyltransferase involved in cell wall biosynthesis
MQDEISGILFDYPTVESLADAIERAQAHPWVDALVRANAERFTAARFRREFAEQVRQLLQTG